MSSNITKSVNSLTRFEQLLAAFKKSKFDYPDIHKHENLSDKILWVLRALKEKFRVDWTSAFDIADILVEALDESATEKSVKNALAPLKGKKIFKKETELGVTVYKIMDRGLKHLEELNVEGKSNIYVIGGQTPRKDKQFLADIIKSTKDEIKVVDTYFGSKSLSNLEKFYFGKSMRVLTTKIQLEKGQSNNGFNNDLKDFKKSHKKFEVRIFPNNPKELHDRYILAEKVLVLVGHGIKDMGDRESFILTFDNKSAGNVLYDLNAKFEERWKISSPV